MNEPMDDLDRLLAESPEDTRQGVEQILELNRQIRALYQARIVQGISQRTVADRMGTTQSAISELENETTSPRIATLERYARAIGYQFRISVEPLVTPAR